jgi:hypothetical protein
VSRRKRCEGKACIPSIHFSFGPLLAFVRLWIECIILRPCIGAIQALTFGLYIAKPFFPDCDPPDEAVRHPPLI